LNKKLDTVKYNPFNSALLSSGVPDYSEEVPLFRLQVLNDFINEKLGLKQKVKQAEEFIYTHTRVISLSPTVKHY
jgi:hypothetical protein